MRRSNAFAALSKRLALNFCQVATRSRSAWVVAVSGDRRFVGRAGGAVAQAPEACGPVRPGRVCPRASLGRVPPL